MRLRRATQSEVLRLRAIADYQFGYPAGDLLIPDDAIVGISPATRRIREVYGSEGLLAVLRAHDYLYSLSINGARRLLALPEPRLRAIVSSSEISKSIPCYKIISIDEELRPGDEVIILSKEKELLGIGRLRLSPLEIREGCGSEAIRVRKRVRKEEE